MNFSREEKKQIVKEAIKEWLDECFIEFGKWTFGAFLAALLAALIYFMIWINGFTKLPDNNRPNQGEKNGFQRTGTRGDEKAQQGHVSGASYGRRC